MIQGSWPKAETQQVFFFHQEIEYLGRQVSQDGIWPSKGNLRAIAEFVPPRTYSEIRAFLGVARHCRCFIKNYAHIASPLTDYLKGDGSKKKKASVVLNKEAIKAFNTLKHSVLSAPVLVYPNPKKEYLLELDTSCLGLGAILSQHQEDAKYHLVTFGSCTLLPTETRYHSTKLELLAMKWGITHFSLDLMGKRFRVQMDNNPLVYFMTPPNLDTMKHRWIGELAPHEFSVED